MEDKPVNWVGSSKEDIGSFPEDARRKIGFQLRAVQRGETPVHFKPISIIGKGVQEIRIRTENAYRIFYVVRFEEAIYVGCVSLSKKENHTNRPRLVMATGE